MDSKIFITGANGQLGTALRAKYPKARFADIDELDITDIKSVNAYDWSGIKILINAAAFTNVDGAEEHDGRIAAWKVNATAVGNLTSVAQQHDLTLVHVSTEYVFDGTQDNHQEDEPYSPLSMYSASKAAGDLLVSQLSKHYILRISWLIGEGKNFVRTMLGIGAKGINPSVVSDQIGRLTFTSTVVNAIDHLLKQQAEFGTYNLSNSGPSASWADITRKIFEYAGYTNTVTDITTEEYFNNKPNIAPRPLKSTLDLSKITATGLSIPDWQEDLEKYVKSQQAQSL